MANETDETKNLLTTTQLAELTGKTGQTIRNTVKELGMKPVSTKGRTLLFSAEQATEIINALGVDKVIAVEGVEEDPLIKSLHAQVKLLTEQLGVKDSEIEAKNNQLANKDKQISALLDNLTTSQKQLQEAQSSIHALSASNAVHTFSDNRETLLATNANESQPEEEKEEDSEPQTQEVPMTRWMAFKYAFGIHRKKKG